MLAIAVLVSSVSSFWGSLQGRRGEALYAPLRVEAEAKHYGKFLSIDVETCEHAMGDTSQQAYNQILSKRPDAMLYTLRVGYRVAGKV